MTYRARHAVHGGMVGLQEALMTFKEALIQAGAGSCFSTIQYNFSLAVVQAITSSSSPYAGDGEEADSDVMCALS